ncbi:MAG TPA: ATP-dependent DNA ligase [Hyphomonadaceae bacterium]|jgi:DNA ligase-1
MLLSELVHTSQRVADTPRRLEKIAALADLLRRLAPAEIGIAVAYLVGETPQGKIGIGPAVVNAARPAEAASSTALTLADVDAALQRLVEVTGAGSTAQRRQILGALLSRATPAEQDFLVRLLYGELRQGALEGIMLEAIARAAALPVSEVRRAAMLAGGLARIARPALEEGAAGLRRFGLTLFQPVLPMLAQPAEDVDTALAQLGTAALEWKLDGARVQVHKSGDDVRVYTRNLNDVTAAVPEVVEAVRGAGAGALILDGESIALTPAGAPQPFQVTMRRFGRKLGVEAVRAELPLSVFFFDILHRDGQDLIDRPARERFAAMTEALPSGLLVPRLITQDAEQARAFFADALHRGHEGLMAKALDSSYEAGARGSGWLKVKQAHTLDLVVLAAEWGHGRRRGWLSNLHLGARDPASGGFVMLGKTFKGLTDAMLESQTRALLALEVARDAYTVYVRPELVVEIAVNEIQESPQYPAGMALRFARVKRYRPDKGAAQADTLDAVRALFERRKAYVRERGDSG